MRNSFRSRRPGRRAEPGTNIDSPIHRPRRTDPDPNVMTERRRARPSRPHPRSRRARPISALAVVAAGLFAAGCASIPFVGRGRTEFWGFTAPWDARSAASAIRHAGALDAVVTGWTTFDTVTGRPYALFADSTANRAAAGRRRLMLVTSYAGDRFHPQTVLALAASTPTLADAAGTIARAAQGGGFRGLVLDLEGHAAPDVGQLVMVVKAIADSARARGVRPVVVAVPAGDTAAYPSRALLDAGADQLLVMLYDEHWASSPAGPIASPEWVAQRLAARVAEVGPDRLVAGLPLYGYHWRRDGVTDVVSFDDARRIATTIGVPLTREPASRTLRAVSADSSQLWVTDAELLATLVDEVRRSGVRTISLWRLGLEDPAVWGSVVK